MPLGFVPGLAPAQKTMQHNGIQQRLQRVVGVQHRLDELRPAVVGGRHELGRDHRAGWSCNRRPDSGAPAIGHPQHHVDRSRQIATQRLAAERHRLSRSAYGHIGSAGARCSRSTAPISASRISGICASLRSPRAKGISKSSSRSRSCIPISRRVSPSASGPSTVSCIGTSAAARVSGATPVGHQSCCSTTCSVSSAARSAG